MILNVVLSPAFLVSCVSITLVVTACSVVATSYLERAPASLRFACTLGAFAVLCFIPLTAVALSHRSASKSFSRAIVHEPTVASDREPLPTKQNIQDADAPYAGTDDLLYLRWLAVLSYSLSAVWMLGIVVTVLVTRNRVSSRPRFQELVVPLSDSRAQTLLERMRLELQIKRRVRLGTSQCACPFTYGILRPWIVLPPGFTDSLPKKQLEAALIHELMHVRRHDVLIEAIVSVLCQGYWWCPYLGYLRDELSSAAEELCDKRVREIQGTGKALAELIVSSVESAVALPRGWTVGMSQQPARLLKRRVTLLLRPIANSPNALLLSLAAIFPLACATGVAAWNHHTEELRFMAPYNLGPVVNSGSPENAPFVSSDGLQLYFQSPRAGSLGGPDLWVTTRRHANAEWSLPKNSDALKLVNTPGKELLPSLSPDGLELLFSGEPQGVTGASDMYRAIRLSQQMPWSAPEELSAALSSEFSDEAPRLRFDGLEIAFNRSVPGQGSNLFTASRSASGDEWTNIRDLGPVVNSDTYDYAPTYSPDGLSIVFDSLRSGSRDLWIISRKSLDAPWERAIPLQSLNTIYTESTGSFSDDGTFYFLSDRPGGHGSHDIWASRMVVTPSLGTMIPLAFACPLSCVCIRRRLRAVT